MTIVGIGMHPIEQHIPAGRFKANCLKIMDDVNQQNTVIVITKHGKPVAKLVPFTSPEKRKSLFGVMKGSLKIVGDIVQPTGEAWEADAE